MTSDDLLYLGPRRGDLGGFRELPETLRQLLERWNGFVAFGGGLHVRGICQHPSWHSLHEVWRGAHALERLYPAVQPSDLPFAEDCMGDQFLLRGPQVLRLAGETGELDLVSHSLEEFLERAEADPLLFLALGPLRQILREGKILAPGQILVAYPPYCSREAEQGVVLRPVPTLQGIRYLSDLARRIADLRDGAPFRFEGFRAE